LAFKPDKDKDYLFDTLMDKNTTPRLTLAKVQTEAEDILIAGSDTTATTLTYACVHLARKPELWERLYQEIKPVYGNPVTIPEVKVLETLTFLTACIKESKSAILSHALSKVKVK
jgi:cytochrome P450